MKAIRLMIVASTIALACGAVSTTLRVEAQTAEVTRCDISIPISIKMEPLNQPEVGKAARFQVLVDSKIDPDLVEEMRVEYEIPEGVRLAPGTNSSPALLARSGKSRMELAAIVPDQARYPIRARVIVNLRNGKTLSQTAVQWIDLGLEDAPEGMIGRIVGPDGTGIRVYQGRAVK